MPSNGKSKTDQIFNMVSAFFSNEYKFYIQIMFFSKIDERGRITLPAEARELCKLKFGSDILIFAADGEIKISLVDSDRKNLSSNFNSCGSSTPNPFSQKRSRAHPKRQIAILGDGRAVAERQSVKLNAESSNLSRGTKIKKEEI